MSAIRLIVGFGNPGSEYERTRHNAGFWFVDALAAQENVRFLREVKLHSEVARLECNGERILLARPLTFMNRSGQALAALTHYYKLEPEQVLVAHDELDLPVGVARLKFDGGHGGQNGLRDSIAVFGHGKFHRLRIGIGHPGHKDQVTPWVLGRPSIDQEKSIRGAIADAIAVLPQVLGDDLPGAMKALHTAK
jgi:PTH1 family peptidyl-tRNA hydrolase